MKEIVKCLYYKAVVCATVVSFMDKVADDNSLDVELNKLQDRKKTMALIFMKLSKDYGVDFVIKNHKEIENVVGYHSMDYTDTLEYTPLQLLNKHMW